MRKVICVVLTLLVILGIISDERLGSSKLLGKIDHYATNRTIPEAIKAKIIKKDLSDELLAEDCGIGGLRCGHVKFKSKGC